MMKQRGLDAEQWDTADGISVMFGQKLVPGAKRTILFYAHYDGQPVDAKRAGLQPDPFQPVLRTDSSEAGGKPVTDLANAAYPDAWRIYARAAGDDKVPIEAILVALDAIKSHPKENVKIIFDGEEEGGGTGLAEVIKKYPDKLKSDLLVICDGPEHASAKPTIYYGARGGANLTVTVFTAKQGLHSGNYGNWMPDANVRLAQLISSMVDPSGKVVIAGFYQRCAAFRARCGGDDEGGCPMRPRKCRRRSASARWMARPPRCRKVSTFPPSASTPCRAAKWAAWIPASYATAEIAMRLVKENSPRTMVKRVTDHIRAQGYFIVASDPDIATLAAHARIAKIVSRGNSVGSGAWRTDPNDPMAVFATNALKSAWGNDIVRVRTTGGGVPATGFIDAYHVPVVGIPIANYDDNQHSDNENLRLGNLFDGVVTLAAMMNY